MPFPDLDPDCVIVGAGLTGATAAYGLRSAGLRPVVFEREDRVGGHIRNEWFRGIPYEPNGAHIFHTSDDQVWQLASSVADFMPYEHQVKTRVRGTVLSWPVQLEEIRELDEWPRIEKELASRPDEPMVDNFETWCVSIMGRTLYELFIESYTAKQWGRPARELSSEFAPKRVEFRDDGYRGLFRDPHQGWPRKGYAAIVEALLGDVSVVFSHSIDCEALVDVVRPDVPVIVTGPLDDFFGGVDGDLEWRGVRLEPHYLPGVTLAQEAMVVNEPDADVPYTRTIESKWVFPEDHGVAGTVVCYEYPGATVKHYPVYDARGANKAVQQSYARRLHGYERNPLFAAGRLARYLYINMDEAMRQGLDAAAEVRRFHAR